MRHAETFNFKYMAVFRKTAEKARQYQTPDEAAELEQLLHRLDSVESEMDIPEPERDRIADRFDEIIRLSTNRLIMDTFPHDLETLMQDAESDLIELDPQRIKAAWLERRAEMLEKAKARAEDVNLEDGDTFTRTMIARCMEPYVQAFLVFGHDLTLLESLLDKYDTAQKIKKRHILTKKPTHLTFPLDKVNHEAFEGLLVGVDPMTGKPHRVNMQKSERSKNGVFVYVSISFDDVDISEPLDINDEDILNLVYSYMLAGNDEMPLRRILEEYGQARPTENQVDAAYKRLRKLRNADIMIDCKEWAKLKRRKTYSIYKRSILDGIAFEEIRNEKTGALLDVVLHCARPVTELPLYQFAEMSGQITQIPIKCAMITGDNSITDKTGAIRHILLERISRKHNSDTSGKITLLSTIYEKIGAETRTEKNRARDQVKRFMLEWVKNGTLYGFAFRKSGKTFDAVVFARSQEEMKEAKAENANLDTWYSR